MIITDEPGNAINDKLTVINGEYPLFEEVRGEFLMVLYMGFNGE